MRIVRALHPTLLLAALVGAHAPALPAAGDKDPVELASRALESGDPALLARLFPADRKVKVSLDRIADLKGFVGSGPLVEAFRRYLAPRSDIRFSAEGHSQESDDGQAARVRGTLASRDKSGRKDKIALVLRFELLRGEWRAVEVREAG